MSTRWQLLIHQLPPKPLYLRARIRQRLARVGAVALKNSVYLLPDRESCREDLQWIAQEAIAGGGEAFVGAVEWGGPSTAEEIVARFQRDRAADYEALAEDLRESRRAAPKRPAATAGEDLAVRLRRARRRLTEIGAIDFFAAPERAHVEALVAQMEARVRGTREPAPIAGRSHPAAKLAGRTWVTRRGVHVDRIASAWLVRRFIDPAASFRFVDAASAVQPGEIGFDMLGAEFTHEGERCTFETLLARLALHEPGLERIAEIVHEIDLKDGKFGSPEAAGIEQLILGICHAHPKDEERLERGAALFDDLYRAFGPRSVAPRPRPPSGKR